MTKASTSTEKKPKSNVPTQKRPQNCDNTTIADRQDLKNVNEIAAYGWGTRQQEQFRHYIA